MWTLRLPGATPVVGLQPLLGICFAVPILQGEAKPATQDLRYKHASSNGIELHKGTKKAAAPGPPLYGMAMGSYFAVSISSVTAAAAFPNRSIKASSGRQSSAASARLMMCMATQLSRAASM